MPLQGLFYQVRCAWNASLNVKSQVVLNGLLYLSLLDSDVSLCNCGTAMLQEMLDKGDVIPAVPVNLGGIELPERMRPYILDAKVIADDAQLLLHCSFRNREDHRCRSDMVFKTIELDELVESHRNGEVSGFACLLLHDGKAVSVPILYNIVQPES